MELEQIEQLFKAYASGFFANNYLEPKYEERDTYVKILKRKFREYMIDNYGIDVILMDVVSVDDWTRWVDFLLYDDEVF